MLLVLLAMASIQTGAAVAKQLFPMVGALGATALRATLSALMLCAFWRPWRALPKGKGWRPILLYGLALGVMNLSFYLALARVPLGVAVTLEFTGPLGLALLGSRRRLDLVWGLLAVAGVALLMPLGAFAASLDPIGVAFALTAGICWALYIVAGKRAGSGDSHSGITAALGLSVAALVALPPGLVTAGDKFLNPSIWPFALAIALFSSALPYSLEMIALKRLPARSFGILMSLGPAFAALSGLLILHERLGLNQWIAIALVVAASIGSTLTTQDTG